MRNQFLKIFILLNVIPLFIFSQNGENGISILNNEFIFSYSNYPESNIRFSGFPNINFPVYILIGRNNPYLMESGINIRNIGIIIKDSIKNKNRAISVGLPLKFTITTKPSILIGAEFDFELFSKQKSINNSGKQKEKDFISPKINIFQPAITAEIVITKDFRIKGSYYIRSFFNENYIEGNDISMYHDVNKSNIFYLSIVTGLYKATTRPHIIRLSR